MEKIFNRVRSIKDITVFVSLALVGVLLTALPIGEAASIAGFFIIIAAAILALVLKSAYKEVETKVEKRSVRDPRSPSAVDPRKQF